MAMLEKEDKEWIAARYVAKDDCNERQAKNAEKFANDDKRIALFSQKLQIWDKLFWVVTGSVVGQLVVSIFSLIRG